MTKFTIASYNIYKDDGDFPNRIYELSHKINSKKFDVICLQEDFESKEFSSSRFLNNNLGFNYITTRTRQKIRKDILSSSNLTIMSKYDISLLEEIYFNKNEKEERACQIIEVIINKSKLLLVNTHLSHISSKERALQIEQILNYIKKYDKYDITMFCGDLNAQPNSDEIELIRKKGFKDKNIQHSHENGVIIDYIFYKTNIDEIQVKSKIVLKSFSDHYCLVNKFEY